jgi:hypothetical protein
MVRLWKTWISVNAPQAQIEKIGKALDTDENVRAAVATKYTFMVMR